jgi:hypothetical protein
VLDDHYQEEYNNLLEGWRSINLVHCLVKAPSLLTFDFDLDPETLSRMYIEFLANAQSDGAFSWYGESPCCAV